MDTSVIERNFKPPVSKKSTDRSRWMTSNISNRIKEAIKKLQNFEKIEFPIIINALKVPPIFILQTSSNSVVALLQLVSYLAKLSRFYTFHVDIKNIHLLPQRNCQNKQKYMFQM